MVKKNYKLNNHGFVLAETLVVSVFLTIMFTMIYSNYYPIIGEYEKRENYDDVDSEYAAYWIKELIEDPYYDYSNVNFKKLDTDTYFQFKCSDFTGSSKKNLCINLVKAFQINCISDNNCQIYVTKYQIGDPTGGTNNFKYTVKNAPKGTFSSGFKDYVAYLQNYKIESRFGSKYRVFLVIKHQEDYNNYLTYSNIEVNR